ncbi:MAG TPA: hypothetical protein VEL74_14570 [Thermoanaerobaculia bacterium]|nr:hypothetical protein [Thermoanaerobaculia bacterium]
MIRPSLRRLSALALILVMTVLFAAPAGAGPVPREEPPAKEESGWLDTALTVLSKLLPEKALDLTLPRLPLLPLDHTGSCIDPLGNPCIFRPW